MVEKFISWKKNTVLQNKQYNYSLLEWLEIIIIAIYNPTQLDK